MSPTLSPKHRRVLALIPARGGSKGFPRKNILPLNGHPLIAHSIRTADASKLITTTAVATDNQEIARMARRYGVRYVVLLPSHLTKDRSPVIHSVLYAIAALAKEGLVFDAVALLEPTSPLRKKDDIDNAIRILFKNRTRTDAVVSLGEIHLESPYIVKTIKNGRMVPLIEEKNVLRQQLPKTYFPYGVVYLCKTSVLKKQKTFYPKRIMPYFIERWQNYEIDDQFDFWCIEAILKYKTKHRR